MSKVLSLEALRQYREEGYFFPVPVLPEAEARAFRQGIEAFEAAQGHPIQGTQRNKSHLLFRWLDDLIRDPRILDVIEDLIGPDLLCWNTVFWIKESHSPTFVSWHQDIKYWGLDSDDMVTAWIALSPATLESGCMKVLPRSHRGALLPHADRFHKDNLLTRGQEVAVEVEEARTVAMPLRPGQMSLHNVRMAHASGPNRSDDRRIGVSLHYMPTRTRQLLSDWDSAALVRGVDRYGHFAPTPRITRDLDPEAVAFHERAALAVRQIVYKDSGAREFRL